VATVRGLQLHDNIVQFEDMSPTVGILAKNMDKFDLDIRSFRVPLERSVQGVMAPSFQRNFDVGGRPPWAPLSETTKLLKQKLGYGNRGTLVRTGLLRRVVGQKNIWSIGRNGALITGKEQGWQRATERGRTVGLYARLHQGGYEGQMMSGRAEREGGMREALESMFADINEAYRTGTTMTTSRSRPIPARPFIMMQGDDMDDIEQVFADWLDERMTRVFERGAL
jgi:phage gpG-like protein